MSAVAAVKRASLAGALVELAKPRITFMVLCTTAGGWYLAPGNHGAERLLLTLIGVALLVGGANALNMVYERDVDAKMARTRNRPLPTGRVSPAVAAVFGAGLGVASLPFLWGGGSPLTVGLSLLSYVLYVWAYTPLKRRSPLAILVGAVPGAMPPLLGWTAVTGTIDAGGAALFLVLFLWQLPHFVAISLFRAGEYEAAGLKVVPLARGDARAKEWIAFYSMLTVLASLQIAQVGVSGQAFAAVSLLLGGGLIALAFYGMQRDAGDRWARWYFRYTLIYLPVLFLAAVLDRS